MSRYGISTAKRECPYCGIPVYPGNESRHRRKCLRTPEEKRRMAFEARLRAMGRERE